MSPAPHTILVAVGDQDLGHLLVRWLTAAGFRVAPAVHRGAIARVAGRDRPAAAVLDRRVPPDGWLAAVREVRRAAGPDLPVVLVGDHPGDGDWAWAAAVTGVQVVPPQADQVAAAVRRACGSASEDTLAD